MAFRIVVAIVLFVAVVRAGVWFLRLLARPQPLPPPPGELRKVNVRYRCSVCGMEMKVLLAPDEAPVPPHHCMEEMQVTSLGEE